MREGLLRLLNFIPSLDLGNNRAQVGPLSTFKNCWCMLRCSAQGQSAMPCVHTSWQGFPNLRAYIYAVQGASRAASSRPDRHWRIGGRHRSA